MFEDLGHARVLPDCTYGGGDVWLQRCVWIGIHCVLDEEFALLSDAWGFWSDIELAHGGYERFGAINDIFVDGMAV